MGFQCCFLVVCTKSCQKKHEPNSIWLILKFAENSVRMKIEEFDKKWIQSTDFKINFWHLLAKSRSFGDSSSCEAAERKFGCLVRSGEGEKLSFSQIWRRRKINQLVHSLQVLEKVGKDGQKITYLGCRGRDGGGSASLQASPPPPCVITSTFNTNTCTNPVSRYPILSAISPICSI